MAMPKEMQERVRGYIKTELMTIINTYDEVGEGELQPEVNVLKRAYEELKSEKPLGFKKDEMRNWSEFRESKMLWFVNKILHSFGWVIVVEVDTDTHELIKVYPKRAGYTCFPPEVNERNTPIFQKFLAKEFNKPKDV